MFLSTAILAAAATESIKIKQIDQHHTDRKWSRDWTRICGTTRPIFFPLPSVPEDQWQRGKEMSRKAKELEQSEKLGSW